MKNETTFIFDIDDTLYDQVSPIIRACEEATGEPLPDEMQFYQLFRIRSNEVFYQVESGAISLEESRILRFQYAMADLGISVTRDQAGKFQRLYEENALHIQLSDVLIRFFAQCSLRGVRMGVVTNGPHEHQMKKFFNLGLERWISPYMVVVSGSAGFAKPDPRIFRFAERKMGLDPEHTWMVGDSLKNDIGGARAAGWNTLWLARHVMPFEKAEDFAPDLVAHTEEEMCEALLQILQREEEAGNRPEAVNDDL